MLVQFRPDSNAGNSCLHLPSHNRMVGNLCNGRGDMANETLVRMAIAIVRTPNELRYAYGYVSRCVSEGEVK